MTEIQLLEALSTLSSAVLILVFVFLAATFPVWAIQALME